MCVSHTDVRFVRVALGPCFACSARRDEGSLTLTVHKCFYMDYFREQRVPFLTTVFCAVDDQFGKNLNSKFRYTRPATMPRGQKACLFVFEQMLKDGERNLCAASV